MTNKPVIEIRDGAIKVTVWPNDSEKGTFYSVELVRSYKDGENWKESRSLSGGDVLRGANLLTLAHNEILHLKATEKVDA